MTRLLYWNIENFALNKIADPVGNRRQKGSAVMRDVASQNRLWLIQQIVTAAAPEVIVVVEIETGYDAPGRLARGTGLTGARTLLTSIRGWLGASWMLVPPIQTGPREAVAVYYDSTRRFFTGPYVWPGGALATAADPVPGPVAPANYPNAPVNVLSGLPDPATGVPARGNIPAGALHNVGRPERHCAAQTAGFTYSANNMLNVGNPIVWGAKARAPYMVTFAETNLAGAVTRNLTIFGIHAPAKLPPAKAHMRLLADTAQIVDGIGANETRVVVGDFNINLMAAGPTYAISNYYTLLPAAAGPNYVRALSPLAVPPAPVGSYPDYLATHIRSRRTAACWAPNADPARYPGYKYTGSDRIANFYAIDNLFYANSPAPGNFTILNPLVGTPFTSHAAPFPVPGPGGSGTRLQGALALGRYADVPPLPPTAAVPPYPAGPGPAQGPVAQAGLPNAFRAWSNYGYIRSTSDHLPLAMDV